MIVSVGNEAAGSLESAFANVAPQARAAAITATPPASQSPEKPVNTKPGFGRAMRRTDAPVGCGDVQCTIAGPHSIPLPRMVPSVGRVTVRIIEMTGGAGGGSTGVGGRGRSTAAAAPRRARSACGARSV